MANLNDSLLSDMRQEHKLVIPYRMGNKPLVRPTIVKPRPAMRWPSTSSVTSTSSLSVQDVVVDAIVTHAIDSAVSELESVFVRSDHQIYNHTGKWVDDIVTDLVGEVVHDMSSEFQEMQTHLESFLSAIREHVVPLSPSDSTQNSNWSIIDRPPVRSVASPMLTVDTDLGILADDSMSELSQVSEVITPTRRNTEPMLSEATLIAQREWTPSGSYESTIAPLNGVPEYRPPPLPCLLERGTTPMTIPDDSMVDDFKFGELQFPQEVEMHNVEDRPLVLEYNVIKHGRRGKPKLKTLTIDMALGEISWRSGSILIKDVCQIRRGRQTAVLNRKHAVSSCEGIFASLVTKNRTVDLELSTRSERNEVVQEMQRCISRYMAGESNRKLVWLRRETMSVMSYGKSESRMTVFANKLSKVVRCKRQQSDSWESDQF
jgi:hypothetical protein